MPNSYAATNPKKFLDADGLTYFSRKLNQYPTNEVIEAVIEGTQDALDEKIDASSIGQASGVAALDENGKVPSTQLPSYVDDVLEYATKDNFPLTGETSKIYVDLATNKTYRWGGSEYVEISASLALGETSATAYRGDRGKEAYDHASAKGTAYASGLYKITTNSEGHVTAATAVQKSDITAFSLTNSDVGLGNVTNDEQIAKSIGTTAGDIIYFTGDSTPARLAIGTSGQVLTVNSSGVPAWASGGGGGTGDVSTITMNGTTLTPTAGDIDLGTVITSHQDISGKVSGPSSVTNNRVAVFDGTTGKVIKDSGYTIAKSVPSNAVFTDTTYSAGTALTLDGTTFKMTKANVTTALNLLGTGTSDLTADGYIMTWYDSSDTTDFTRRKASSVVNATLVKAALGTDGSTTTKCLTQKGTWATFASSDTHRKVALNGTNKFAETSDTELDLVAGTNMSITYATGGHFTFTPDLSGCATSDHTHNTLTMNRTSTGNWLNLQGNSTQVGRLYWGTVGAAGTEGFSILQLGNATAKTAANNASGQIRLYNSNGGYIRMTGTYGTLGGSSEDYVNVPEQLKAAKVWGAVWNDYAEMRKVKTTEAGRCVTETISGEMELTEGRLQAGCRIISDTYGFCIGETAEAKTPIAVCGRVLAYPYKDPSAYHLGDAVCSAPNGTVDIMTREEVREYPERIIGTVSEIPKYEKWVAGGNDNPTEIPVNGRIWIYVR